MFAWDKSVQVEVSKKLLKNVSRKPGGCATQPDIIHLF